MAHARTTERVPLPAGAAITDAHSALVDLEQDLQRLNSLLDYLEAHGDDDACNVAFMFRPFSQRLEHGLDAMRVGLRA